MPDQIVAEDNREPPDAHRGPLERPVVVTKPDLTADGEDRDTQYLRSPLVRRRWG